MLIARKRPQQDCQPSNEYPTEQQIQNEYCGCILMIMARRHEGRREKVATIRARTTMRMIISSGNLFRSPDAWFAENAALDIDRPQKGYQSARASARRACDARRDRQREARPSNPRSCQSCCDIQTADKAGSAAAPSTAPPAASHVSDPGSGPRRVLVSTPLEGTRREHPSIDPYQRRLLCERAMRWRPSARLGHPGSPPAWPSPFL